MIKKSFLTPVLAGVLAVTVVGSGVGYYFEFVKDNGGKAEKDGGKDGKSNASLTIDQAASNIEDQLDKVQQIAKGDLEGGYSMEVSYTPGADVPDVKAVAMSVEAKQKDKLSAMDYSIKYDSQNVVSLNVVYDNENETAYVKAPELSDAYVTATMADVESAMKDVYGLDSYGADASATTDTPNVDALENIDFDALFTDIESYGDTIKENAPAATDGANRKVEQGGKSVELTTKAYTVTYDDFVKVINAISDKWKSDETMKSFMVDSLGADEEEYNNMWDSMLEESTEGTDETINLEIYYNGDEIQGIGMKNPEEGGEPEEVYAICAATDDAYIVDWSFMEEDGTGMTAAGALTLDGDTLDGSISVVSYSEDYSSYDYENPDGELPIMQETVTFTCDQLTATDDSLTGTMKITADDGEMVYTFNNSGDNFDMSFSMKADGEDFGTFNMKGQTTDASDITIPTGTMYNAADENELNSYLEGCDVEGWQASVKEILGEELYNEIFGSEVEDYGDYDFSQDYGGGVGDYDFDDYDFDDFDESLYTDDNDYESGDFGIGKVV